MLLELESIISILERAASTYINSSNIRKKKIAKLLFSNLNVDKGKGLAIEVNPSLKIILSANSSSPGLEGIEPPTRSFGDSRSTTELKPYIIIIQSISLILCLKHDISSKELIFDLALLLRGSLHWEVVCPSNSNLLN